jgi:ketosteroid isomerase-like protein
MTCLATTGCRPGLQMPGASFAGSSLLAPLSDDEEAHDGLLRADLARADSMARLGYTDGWATVLASDVVYLRGGLPLVRGRTAALAIAAAESIETATAVHWQPVRAEASRDGRSGYSYGYAVYSTAHLPSPSVRIDRYIAFWRREEQGWRVSAYAETYGTPPQALLLPAAARVFTIADVPMARGPGAIDAIREADTQFSHAASTLGTGKAFGRYAADDAQVFSGPGEFISGPEAIMESFGPPTSGSSLRWHPVAGEISRSGDLGYTVGNAVFTGHREDGAPEVGYSKYLTVWKKQRDGSWRFVADGGSARPADT